LPAAKPGVPSAASPLVSIVVPNWNGAYHLPTCLGSLRRQTYPRLEVIVVDNGSTDDSLVLLARDFPEVRVVALGSNRGYAGGVNAGFRAAAGEILAVLNNDAEADPAWLTEMIAALQRHPEAGMATPKVLLFDRRDTLHTAGDYCGVDGIPDSRGVWQRDEGQFDAEELIFGAAGVAPAYRRTMLDDVGLLDEDFGSYCEDVDLSWRAQLAGYKCIYVPGALVYHKLSATGGGPIASFYVARNTIWTIAKNYPPALWHKNWTHVLRAQIRRGWKAIRAWRGAAARATLRGQMAALPGLHGAWRKRRAIQRTRRVSDEYIESLLIAQKC
jgi:GT2 family glycosyltransferase